MSPGSVKMAHGHPFDPTHGYKLDDLLKVGAPEEAGDFADFWLARRAEALACDPRARLRDTGEVNQAGGCWISPTSPQEAHAFRAGLWCRSQAGLFVVWWWATATEAGASRTTSSRWMMR
nr:hypothetical protein [Verrucomicrobium spinosum]